MPEIPGHSHGSRHPVCVIGMTVHDDLTFDYRQVDDFLSNGFLVSDLPFGKEAERITAIIDRVSFLANSLLQAIKVPVFEQAKIAELQYNQDQRSHRVRLLAPTLANIPQEVVLRAHGFALKILTELHPEYDFEAAFEIIDSEFLEKFKKFIPGGNGGAKLGHGSGGIVSLRAE